MAYKVHVKKLSSNEKNLKQARHERRMAKTLSAELPQYPSAEQIEEIFNTALTNLNTHIGSILKTDYPEAYALMGKDFFETVKCFHNAQMLNILRVIMGQREEELEEFWAVSLLSFAAEHARGEVDNER